jgi:hypothetical protein
MVFSAFLVALLLPSCLAAGAVMDLDDQNFEELTQAATGDWYILMYDDSEGSQAMIDIWEDLSLLAADIDPQINIAKMSHRNDVTAKRLRALKQHP